MGKLSVVTNAEGTEVTPHVYPDVWFRWDPDEGPPRLVIGPRADHVQLMLELARGFGSDEYAIMYVLLEPQTGAASGRYRSHLFQDFGKAAAVMEEYSEYFEQDSRHHVWFGTPTTGELVAYDQHNVLFFYGDIDKASARLVELGFSEQEFWFPNPHGHEIHIDYNDAEERFLKHLDWTHGPLEPSDQWDLA